MHFPSPFVVLRVLSTACTRFSSTMSNHIESTSEKTNSPPAITFKATRNGVAPTKFEGTTHPIKAAIEKHSSYESMIKQHPNAVIIQHSSSSSSSIRKGNNQNSFVHRTLVPCESGLVSVVLRAYNKHHNLILRPDDIWQAVLNQFSLYLTANAEKLRTKVVDFKGQKTLVVKAYGNLFNADFGKLASRMVDEQIASNIKDADVVNWLLPSFTTTTPNDRIAASVSVMSAMQKYFKYCFELCCGIPSVTLLGSVEDWVELRSKFDVLLQFEVDGQTYMRDWHKWLSLIGDNLIQSAKGDADVEFWDRVASNLGGGSGPCYISGWIGAFAVFSDEGLWQGETRKPETFGPGYLESEFPIINTNDLPSGVVAVPVLVDDNGTKHNCTMLSGQFGMAADGCSLSPSTDWCIVTELPKVQ